MRSFCFSYIQRNETKNFGKTMNAFQDFHISFRLSPNIVKTQNLTDSLPLEYFALNVFILINKQYSLQSSQRWFILKIFNRYPIL